MSSVSQVSYLGYFWKAVKEEGVSTGGKFGSSLPLLACQTQYKAYAKHLSEELVLCFCAILFRLEQTANDMNFPPINDWTSRDFVHDPPSCKSLPRLLPSMRSFLINEEKGVPLWTPKNVWFWDTRGCGPPPEDLVAHPGDVYLDTSVVPIGVYQKTENLGWISCWGGTLSKKHFLKLSHPRFKDYFLWTTQADSGWDILLSYIKPEALQARGGTEADIQTCLLQDLRAMYPSIATAETLAAQREAVIQAGNDGLFVTKEDSRGDEDDDDMDQTMLSVGTESNEELVCSSKSSHIFYEEEDPEYDDPCISNSVLPSCKCGSSPKTEPESIYKLSLQLTKAIAKERSHHIMETDSLIDLRESVAQELIYKEAELKNLQREKDHFEAAYNNVLFKNKLIETEQEKFIGLKNKLAEFIEGQVPTGDKI